MQTKRISVKFLAIVSLAVIFFVSIITGLMIGGIKRAYASVLGNDDLFEMVQGSSLKINDDGGLRFRVKMNSSAYGKINEDENVNLYFIITTPAFFDRVDDDTYYETLSAGTKRSIIIPAVKEKIYNEGDYYYANGCVTEILSSHYTTDYVAIAVIAKNGNYEYATVGGKTVSDDDFSISNVRGNVYDVACQAVLYTATDFSKAIFNSSAYSWVAGEDYPLNIKTLTQYENLIRKINGGQNFIGKTILLDDTVDIASSTVSLDVGKVMPEGLCTVHTITFCDEDGTTLKTVTVKDGEAATYGGTPTKDPTAEYTYSFDKWVTSQGGSTDATSLLADVKESLSVYASFESTTREYTITWKNYNGTTLKTDTMAYGDMPEYNGSFEEYLSGSTVYGFSGWTPAITEVSADAEYTAVYEALPTHQVYNYSYKSGSTTYDITEGTITYTTESDDLLENMTSGYKIDATKMTTQNAWYTNKINGNFKAGHTYRFTVKIKYISSSTWMVPKINWDGGEATTSLSLKSPYTSMASWNTPNGGLITSGYSNIKTMTEDRLNWYITIGMNRNGTTEAAPNNFCLVVSIEVEEVYTVTWNNYDDSLIYSEYVAVGSTPSFDDVNYTITTKPAEGLDVYEFTGWTPALATVSGNATYTAVFSAKAQQVTTKNSDITNNTNSDIEGATFTYTEEAEYLPTGATRAYIVDVPTYTNKNFTVGTYLNGNFEAGNTYRIRVRLKLLTWSTWYNVLIAWNQDGFADIGDLNPWTGHTEDAVKLFTSEGYVYDFTPATDVSQQTFQIVINSPGTASNALRFALSVEFEKLDYYTVTWQNYDGTTLETDENVLQYSTPSYDGATPVKPAAGYLSYTFIGWSPEISAVTANVTYTATFKTNYPFETVQSSNADYQLGNADYEYTTEASELPSGAAYAWKVSGTFQKYGTRVQHIVNGDFKEGKTYRVTLRMKVITKGELANIYFDKTGAVGGTGTNVTRNFSAWTTPYDNNPWNSSGYSWLLDPLAADTTQLTFTQWLRSSTTTPQNTEICMSFCVTVDEVRDFEMKHVPINTYKDLASAQFAYTEDSAKLPSGASSGWTVSNATFKEFYVDAQISDTFETGKTYRITVKVKKSGTAASAITKIKATFDRNTTAVADGEDIEGSCFTSDGYVKTVTMESDASELDLRFWIQGTASDNDFTLAFSVTWEEVTA